jgi:hypothetical protein
MPTIFRMKSDSTCITFREVKEYRFNNPEISVGGKKIVSDKN